MWYCLLDDKNRDSPIMSLPNTSASFRPKSWLRYLRMFPTRRNASKCVLTISCCWPMKTEKLVFATRISTGGKRRSGTYTTPSGDFITFHKRPTRHMAAGDIASNGFDLPGVPWVLYITKSGISFHGTYWHNDFGRPRSHGCINLTPQAAKWLYRWTIPTRAAG